MRAGLRIGAALLGLAGAMTPMLLAAVHVTLRDGGEFDCTRQEAIEGGMVRLYLYPTEPGMTKDANYIDVKAEAIRTVEAEPDPVLPAAAANLSASVADKAATALTPAEMQQMLVNAGSRHHVDADLLASVVKAESGGQVRAVSRTGAEGLMQLMPGTAKEQGVADAFRPEQNIAGGTAYLDQLLTRYHDNVALALAAYNAGPAAVDRYHGIPPYRETQAYVARVIREFNRRKQLAMQTAGHNVGRDTAQRAVQAAAMMTGTR
jgi:soluble lytic murein transglycosylase-like protein